VLELIEEIEGREAECDGCVIDEAEFRRVARFSALTAKRLRLFARSFATPGARAPTFPGCMLNSRSARHGNPFDR
jgi:hypothetical protein